MEAWIGRLKKSGVSGVSHAGLSMAAGLTGSLTSTGMVNWSMRAGSGDAAPLVIRRVPDLYAPVCRYSCSSEGVSEPSAASTTASYDVRITDDWPVDVDRRALFKDSCEFVCCTDVLGRRTSSLSFLRRSSPGAPRVFSPGGSFDVRRDGVCAAA
jgi:hypothetical protein